MKARTAIVPIVVVLFLAAARAEAGSINIWLSGSDAIPGGSFLGEVPALTPTPGSTGNPFYVWARPGAGLTLSAWSLNVRSTNSSVLDFTSVTVHNPVIGSQDRWQATGTGALGTDQILGFQGFNIGSGAGIGPSTTGSDLLYDAVADAWLLAAIYYDIVGVGSTNLFLQIGNNGILHAGETSANTNVIFGALTDPFRNGGAERNLDSLTADATITVTVGGGTGPGGTGGNPVPEPSTFVLFGLVLAGLGYTRFRHRP